jgi:hypothetical protein
MSINARVVGSGVQPPVDAVRTMGVAPGDLSAVVWQVTWARGFEDVVVPAPTMRLKEEGFVVFARSLGPRCYATLIDTTHALWALIIRDEMPLTGSRVCLVPTLVKGELGWALSVLETLGHVHPFWRQTQRKHRLGGSGT